METDISDILRKISIASQGGMRRKSTEEQKVRESTKGPEPKDTFYFVHILLILLGVMQLLPGSFFITANDYWMYKFRNTTLGVTDSKHRTSLQAFFVSWSSLVASIPSVISVILSTFFGHKVKTRSRLLLTMAVSLACFVTFTAFIKINTDTWQLTFFCLTMIVNVLIHCMMSLCHASSMTFLTRFPPNFTQFYLYGEGTSGLFSAVMQIISLAIGKSSSENAALIYFTVGSLMIALTLFMIYVSKYFPLVQYYAGNAYDDTKRPAYKMSEIYATLRQIWPCLIFFVVMMVGRTGEGPNITTLVVSEDYGNGHLWADKYFVPVITFLFSDICSLLGRIASRNLKMKRSTTWRWIILIIVRTAIFVPLVMLCNALPRSHLPVVFDRDWEYIVIVGVLGFTGGAIFNIMFLSMQELAAGDEERAYLTMMTFISVISLIISPLNLATVKLL